MQIATWNVNSLSVRLPQVLAWLAANPVDALGLPLRVDHYEERALGSGAQAQAMAIVEVAWAGQPGVAFGAGTSANIVAASVQAVISAANRLQAQRRVSSMA